MGHVSPDGEDDRLVAAAGESFEAFFRREYQRILGLAFALCGSRAVAEELTMDAFEVALRNWPRVSGLESPGGWVRRVLANAAVSRFRRLSAEIRARNRLSGGSSSGLDKGGDVELWDAVRKLSRRQAQVVALFYVEGFSRSEVAQILELSEESVKTHLERARQNLEKELRDAES